MSNQKRIMHDENTQNLLRLTAEEIQKRDFFILDMVVGVLAFTLAVACFSIEASLGKTILSGVSFVFVGFFAWKCAGFESMPNSCKVMGRGSEFKKFIQEEARNNKIPVFVFGFLSLTATLAINIILYVA